MKGLSAEQLESFRENGYLIIEDALSREEVEELKSETASLLNGFSLEGHPMTRFTTGGESGEDEKKHVGDEYFLESNDKIRFFFEEGFSGILCCFCFLFATAKNGGVADAFDSSGTLTKPKHRAINKIGHALHMLSPSFRNTTLTSINKHIAHDLGFRDARVLQSMIICKQPEIGGAVPPHQDSTFLYTDPPSAVGFWYALEDANPGNGCLSFIPGSHKWAPIQKRFVRLPEGGTGFEDLKHGCGDGVKERFGKVEKGEERFVVVPVRSGALALIDGNVLHKSGGNTSESSRWIYTFHVIEGENTYDKKNWLQPTAEGFSRLGDV